MTHLEISKHRIGYHKSGRGPDVLFIHGWPLHGATWRNIVPRLSDSYTCHVIDLPGTGRTQGTPMGLRGHGEVVLEVIERLGLPRLAMVGHDSGGLFARIAAAELGDRCTGLVMGNTEIPGYRPLLLRLLVAMINAPFGQTLVPLSMRIPAVQRSNLGFGGCFDDLAALRGEFGKLFLEPLVRDPEVAAGQMELARSFEWSLLDELPGVHARLEAPVRLIWGVRDPWFPLVKARGMLGQLPPGSDLVEIPGKLLAHEEHPELFARHAKAFLDQVTRTESARDHAS